MLIHIVFYFWMILNIILFVYAALEIILLIYALFSKKKNTSVDLSTYPKVTIQLPVYNEKFVIKRLIDSVITIDYPKDKLEIQLLDDSTDETSEIITTTIQQYLEKGFNVKHIKRENRVGFKAGALDFGMKICEGEFIAIFDADFVPDQLFLKNTIPHFNNPNIGVVQTRWTHLNEKFSFITRAQAIMLNTHFSVEHLGRTSSGAFINFNGTAGVWRKSCIVDAGGWHADTLTEDLDLSFRAQIKGWEFKYLFDTESPAELPITLDAYKTQQFRWSKGAAECMRKNTKLLWASKSTFWSKLIGTAHLVNSSIFIIVFLLILTSPVVFWLSKQGLIHYSNSNSIPFISLFITISIAVMFFTGHLIVAKNKWREIIFFLPNFYMFLAMSISISLYMVIGVIEGYIGKVSEFVRTPKFNFISNSEKLKQNYSYKKEDNILAFELVILSYGVFAFVTGLYYQDFLMANYGFIITLGFTLKVFFSKYVFRF